MTTPNPENQPNAEEQALLDKIAFIRSQIEKIGDLPSQVDSWCGRMVQMIRMDSIASAGSKALSNERIIDMIWEERDRVNGALRDSWSELKKVDPDLEVPVKFIRVANEWRNVKTAIQQAESDYEKTILSTEWHGDAASRYGGMRNTQKLALGSLIEAFEEIARSLEEVAKAELVLYVDLANKVQELEQEVVEFVGNLPDVLVLPLGPLNAVAELANVTEAARTFIVGTIGSMADSAATMMIESNRIEQNEGYQRGLPDNRWPPGVKGAYGNGLDGIKNAIGDGTTQDGDKSDWVLGPAPVVVAQ
ncbi:hypothetical protein [Nocardia farcinica]|uniref:hypothetical protein n=2 Tax=Nocardia farcinica TaxID=37329 RepID=UPI0024582503|nr:hypothetical protein [Nocardia farcinica]